MELRDYLKIIAKYFKVFIIITVITAVGAAIFTQLQPVSYLASTTFTVNKESSLDQKNVNYYLFDNYYNVQSAGLFSQIVATWFESPALVKEIYERAGVAVPSVSQKKLGKTFKAVREEPATINVSISGKDREELSKLITAATNVIQEKTNELGKNSESFYELAKFQPIVSENIPSVPVNSIVGLVIGMLLGAFACLMIEYFKKEEE